MQTINALMQPAEGINSGILKSGPLSNRFDATILAPHIVDAELAHIMPVICEPLYSDMITKKSGRVSNYNAAAGALVVAFPAITDAKYETLWRDHLSALCAWAAYYEALPYMVMQSGSNGIYTMQSEHGQHIGVAQMKSLQDSTLRRIQQKASILADFLCKNKKDYPLFCAEKCPGECGCDSGQGEKQTSNLSKTTLYYI